MTNTNILTDVDKPGPFPGGNRRLLTGSILHPLKRLETFSPDEFEIFVAEWAFYSLQKKYNKVQRRGGAGDKGRDVIAWIDDQNTNPRRWDCYQCKHYNQALSPSEFCVELGKLCYFTFNNHYTIPERYYIVTHKGIGPALNDLIDQPEKLRCELIDNWDSRCKSKITKSNKIDLTGDFKKYVEEFDFSILEEKTLMEILDEHRHTPYHHLIFGTGLRARPAPSPLPPVIGQSELKYIQQLYLVYAEKLNRPINDESDFNNENDLVTLFNRARRGFFSVEDLRKYSQEALLEEVFDNLVEQYFHFLDIVVRKTYPNSYEKLQNTQSDACTLQINSNGLNDHLDIIDKIGICHQLVNEDKIKWVA